MKLNLNKALIPVTALAVSWSFVACEKPADKPAEPPKAPATEQPAKAADSAKPAETPVKAVAAVTPSANVANLSATYGFAARLPKDVEMFSDSYRLHELWASVAKSKWAATLVDLLKKEPEANQMLERWNTDPGIQKGKEMAEAFLGNEFFTAGTAGVSANLGPWVEFGQQFIELYYQAAITGGMLGGNPADTQKAMMRMFKDNADELLPKAVKLEIPPLLMGFKAGKVRAEFDAFIKQGLDSGNLPPFVESSTFKVADKYSFQSLSIMVRKAVPPSAEEGMVAQLKELVGDEAKAKSLVAALMAKHFEVSWGWVDDYLVISLGSDHAHVKLASSEADSALSIPDVAARAAMFAGKQPIGIEYYSKALFDQLSHPMELAAPFAKITESIKGIIAPAALASMNADVKRFEGKVQALFKVVNSSQVSVSYVDGGLRADLFGGPRSANAKPSQPLAFSTLATPTTVMSLIANDSSGESVKTGELIEEGASMVWGWYKTHGAAMMPEDGKQQAAMMEAMAVPMVKDLWKSMTLLGTAFGDNLAMLVDLNGAMPPVPGAPKTALEGGKIPRAALVMDIKNRAALSEAWKGFEKLVKQGIALVPQGADAPPIPEPQMRKEGDVEIHYVELPVKMGDLLPHIAISKDKWILSTSPTYSVELAKLPTAGTTKADGEMTMSFGAIANFADHWVKLASSNPSDFFAGKTDEIEMFQKVKPMIEVGINLVRAIKSASIQMGEEGGKTHATMSLLVEDLK